jgi:hypothetical protein
MKHYKKINVLAMPVLKIINDMSFREVFGNNAVKRSIIFSLAQFTKESTVFNNSL